MKDRKSIHPDVWLSIIVILISAYVFFSAQSFPTIPKRFPIIFSSIFALFGLVVGIKGVRKTQKGEVAGINFGGVKYAMITCGIIILYAIGIDLIGFYISTALFMVGCLFFMGVRSWKTIVLVTLFTEVGMWGIFAKLLSLRLP